MKRVFRRFVLVLPALILQVLWYITLIRVFNAYAIYLNGLLALFSIIFVFFILSRRDEGTYKQLWITVLLVFPLLGTILYVSFGNKRTARPIRKRLNKSFSKTPPLEKTDYIEKIEEEDLRIARIMNSVMAPSGMPIQKIETCEYYPLGDDMYPHMLTALRGAKKFIYCEYFIVNEGILWNSFVDIMAEKAKEGVEVLVMYDDIGSISTYSYSNVKKLRAKGIKCQAFNPMYFLHGTANYRDHRKILVVDNEVAFSGGINLSDEYINKKVRFGHWKDIGFKVTGDAVKNFTYMFCTFWNAFSKTPITENTYEKESVGGEEGYVLSYFDTPVENYATSNTLYIELLSQAKNYVWFYTPYLMLGDMLLDAFCRAAERGVDVKIIMPGIPDKKRVYKMSKSYYKKLLDAGVEIYEYSKGFVHSKACIFDDTLCTIGTVNLDYRSLYLHFENNSLFYKSKILFDLKDDFMKTLKTCRKVELSDIKRNVLHGMADAVRRFIAPLF